MIYFVSGPACAGKTYYIKHHFPNAVVVDLYTFQSEENSIAKVKESYDKCALALEEAVRNNPTRDIVLEHTLLKAKRRPQYIEAIRKVNPQAQITMIFLCPPVEILMRNAKLRGCPYTLSQAKEALSAGDIPTIAEGFSRIILSSNDNS